MINTKVVNSSKCAASVWRVRKSLDRNESFYTIEIPVEALCHMAEYKNIAEVKETIYNLVNDAYPRFAKKRGLARYTEDEKELQDMRKFGYL